MEESMKESMFETGIFLTTQELYNRDGIAGIIALAKQEVPEGTVVLVPRKVSYPGAPNVTVRVVVDNKSISNYAFPAALRVDPCDFAKYERGNISYHKANCTGGGADVICIENCISDESCDDYSKQHYKCECCLAEWYE